MSEKLKDYQVIDVFCNGTFYKVRHKVTNNIFAWKAYNCSAYSDEQIQIIANEVKIINKVTSKSLLRYYDTILHTPSKTLYFVLEYSSWQNVQELIEVCKATSKHIAEEFVWRLLHELARVCKTIEELNINVLRKCIAASSVFVGPAGELRINCFDLQLGSGTQDLMRMVGELAHKLCFQIQENVKIKEYNYSDDLKDVIDFLIDDKNSKLRADVLLYHPTVLSNLETLSRPKVLNDILVPAESAYLTSESNKCDAEKAVEFSRALEPLPRTRYNIPDSPIYCNISPKRKLCTTSNDALLSHASLSPSLAALALELPGFVPRCRKPYTEIVDQFKCPKKVTEETLSHQWMSRLVALRARENALNKREKDLIVKEIINSPSTNEMNLNDSDDLLSSQDSNGITLPPMITQATQEKREWTTRRRRPRYSSIRCKGRRKSFGYEDLDSSLSADTGDSSMIITAKKFTEANMPCRNIFPDISTKKVHFTSSNPFVESDESVTLTFYELEKLNRNSNHSIAQEKVTKDISKFKYLNLQKLPAEKRSTMMWNHSSPSKQAKITKNIFGDITSIKKTPSKSSISSQCSTSSRYSLMSRSQLSVEPWDESGGGSISERTRSSMKQSLAQTPTAPPDLKKGKIRKSLLHFRTPFKFRSSGKS